MTDRLSNDENARAAEPGLLITALDVSSGSAPSLELSGDFRGEAPQALILSGSRLVLSAVAAVTGERWSASIPLRGSRWQGQLLPPPSGGYRLRGVDASGHGIPVAYAMAAPDPLLIPGLFRLGFGVTPGPGGAPLLEFSAPLSDTEHGPQAQTRLEAQYRAARPQSVHGVFFESFYGQGASCNPLAIDRALARLRPDIARYWSVVDASVAVPAGAVALIEGSEQWWSIRGSARLLVVNDWLRKRYRKRRGQKVLQTWHGTPLKRIALDRKGVQPRTAVATVLERLRWSILLSQNPYSTGVFRSAYRFFSPVWEEGYPRNDLLVSGDGAALRQRLGIAPEATVVLYAPTWRDDKPGEADQLDVAAFGAALGTDYVTLLRGHSRSLAPGSDVLADNVIDVTSYPEVSELFLLADILVTDYSSVMFDYSVTGKPIFFFAPDLESYRDRMRGFYFDLAAVAPGPLVQDPAELVELIRDADAQSRLYESRYAAWRQRFNPRDDGGAAERVVRRLIAEGFLP